MTLFVLLVGLTLQPPQPDPNVALELVRCFYSRRSNATEMTCPLGSTSLVWPRAP